MNGWMTDWPTDRPALLKQKAWSALETRHWPLTSSDTGPDTSRRHSSTNHHWLGNLHLSEKGTLARWTNVPSFLSLWSLETVTRHTESLLVTTVRGGSWSTDLSCSPLLESSLNRQHILEQASFYHNLKVVLVPVPPCTFFLQHFFLPFSFECDAVFIFVSELLHWRMQVGQWSSSEQLSSQQSSLLDQNKTI